VKKHNQIILENSQKQLIVNLKLYQFKEHTKVQVEINKLLGIKLKITLIFNHI